MTESIFRTESIHSRAQFVQYRPTRHSRTISPSTSTKLSISASRTIAQRKQTCYYHQLTNLHNYYPHSNPLTCPSERQLLPLSLRADEGGASPLRRRPRARVAVGRGERGPPATGLRGASRPGQGVGREGGTRDGAGGRGGGGGLATTGWWADGGL